MHGTTGEWLHTWICSFFPQRTLWKRNTHEQFWKSKSLSQRRCYSKLSVFQNGSSTDCSCWIKWLRQWDYPGPVNQRRGGGGISWRIYCHTYLCASSDLMLGLGQPEMLSHSWFTIIDRSEYPCFDSQTTVLTVTCWVSNGMTFRSICQGCNPRHWKWQLNNASSLC